MFSVDKPVDSNPGLILSMLILSACQPQTSGSKIVTSGAWGRSSATMAKAGAVFMVIENQGNETDRLIGVQDLGSVHN